MSVFLLILKIIGIVLLVILGLIVVIALLALFCPFVYRVKGSYQKKICNWRSDLVAWPSAGALCRYRGRRDSTRMCGFFGFRKELHLQKEKRRFRGFLKKAGAGRLSAGRDKRPGD